MHIIMPLASSTVSLVAAVLMLVYYKQASAKISATANPKEVQGAYIASIVIAFVVMVSCCAVAGRSLTKK